MKLSVIGLGKLGLCTAACFAEKFPVIGVDNNEQNIALLLKNKSPIIETSLDELLNDVWQNMYFTTSIKEAVLNSEVTFIVVPTPSNPDGRFSNDYILDVLYEIRQVNKKDFHIVVIVSTVMPGSCEQIFKPIFKGTNTHLVYNPEFIALGSVIQNFLNPDFVLIGADLVYAAEVVKRIYEKVIGKIVFKCMTLTEAEIAKLALNCYVTMKISFANELGQICQAISGVNVDNITSAIGADSRIGSKYLRSGLGFGGPCFPRDNIAFQQFATQYGQIAKLGKVVMEINDGVVDDIVNKVKKFVPKNGKVLIMGISYKPNTHITEESHSLKIAEALDEAGFKIFIQDPMAQVSRCRLPINFSEKLLTWEGYDAIIIGTNWVDFTEINWKEIDENVKKGCVLLDCWRIVKNYKELNNFNYIGLGIGV